MHAQTTIRKDSVEQGSDIQDFNSSSIMFPKNQNFSQQETLSLLKLKYNPTIHENYLINYCFRCHKTNLVDFFIKFKNNYTNKIEEPNISNYYTNDCFVNLYQLGMYLQGKNQIYPSIYMGTINYGFKKLIDNLFIQYGYIPNFQRFLLFYPQYLQKHLTLQKSLFQQNQIDPTIAYFLALISCAQLGSVYGINRMLKKFIKVGGNVEWITKKGFPQKIKKLLYLNRVIARQIWKIDSDDIIEQIKQSNLWSQNQLALIIQILTFSHSFATISLAVGLNCQQIDKQNQLIDFQSLKNIKNQYDSHFYESNQGQGQKLAIVIQNLSKVSSDQQNQKSQSEKQKQKKKQKLQKLRQQKNIQGNMKVLKKSLRQSNNEQNIQYYMRQIAIELTNQQIYFKMNKMLSNILLEYQIINKRHDKDYPPKDALDHNFKIKTFPILYNLTNLTAEKALDLIEYSEIMTNNNFGSQSIQNTKSFRKAIRYYSENLCGYFHYQYNYKNITQLLTVPIKFYIRLLTLSPINIKKQVLNQVRHVQQGRINLFDLGHVALITANCKMGLALSCAINSFQY